jgi:hypothetical protein
MTFTPTPQSADTGVVPADIKPPNVGSQQVVLSAQRTQANSLFWKILRVTRLDPRFCEGKARFDRPKANECNILANQPEKTPRSIRQINLLFTAPIAALPNCRFSVVSHILCGLSSLGFRFEP